MCLTDLHINAAALNALLGSGAPVRVLEGSVGTVRVTVSYAEILTKSCVIELAGLSLHVQPVDQSSGAAAAAPLGQAPVPPQPSPAPAAAAAAAGDDPAVEGLDMLAGWVETIVSRIRVRATDVVVSASVPGVPGGAGGPPRRLALHIPALEFQDQTPGTGGPTGGPAPLLQVRTSMRVAPCAGPHEGGGGGLSTHACWNACASRRVRCRRYAFPYAAGTQPVCPRAAEARDDQRRAAVRARGQCATGDGRGGCGGAPRAGARGHRERDWARRARLCGGRSLSGPALAAG